MAQPLDDLKALIGVGAVLVAVAGAYFGVKARVDEQARVLAELRLQVAAQALKAEAQTLAIQELTITLRVKGVIAP